MDAKSYVMNNISLVGMEIFNLLWKVIDSDITQNIFCPDSQVISQLSTKKMTHNEKSQYYLRLAAILIYEEGYVRPMVIHDIKHFNQLVLDFLIELDIPIKIAILNSIYCSIRRFQIAWASVSRKDYDDWPKYIDFFLYLLNSMPYSNEVANFTRDIEKCIMVYHLIVGSGIIKFEMQYFESSKEFILRVMTRDKFVRFYDNCMRYLEFIKQINWCIAEDLRNDLEEVKNELGI